MTLQPAFLVLWIGWGVSWLVAALWASRAATRPRLRDELLYRALTVVAALLIFWLPRRYGGVLWTTGLPVAGLLFAFAVMGLAITWWARLHLGRLWSGNVTRKADHRIVDTGPYGLVRHPIYTGLLLALYATALDRGTIWALLGAAVATAAFVVKAQLEERFLRDELGAAGYDAYRGRVAMLVPRLGRKR
jgi:protein-S-isoprenylcysteine O-methyltransferase Ste14